MAGVDERIEGALPPGAVTVPEGFAAIGFSGLFHRPCSFRTPEEAATWREKAPCLVVGDTWLLLAVDADGVGTMVRKDMRAVGDMMLGRPPIKDGA
jgi:hypothetical protein